MGEHARLARRADFHQVAYRLHAFGIARELHRGGDGPDAYRELEGRYERAPGGGLRFRLTSGVRMDGRRVPLQAVFDLEALAGEGARG